MELKRFDSNLNLNARFNSRFDSNANRPIRRSLIYIDALIVHMDVVP